MTKEEFEKYLTESCDYTDIKWLNDNECACIAKFIFTYAIVICKLNDTATVHNRWCYKTASSAFIALTNWDYPNQIEPDGWHRNPFDGRRRPDGDKSKEYVAL